MTTAVRVSENLVKQAKIYSKIDKRSVTVEGHGISPL